MRKSVKKLIDLFKPVKSTGDLIKAYRISFDFKHDDIAHACKISQANFSAKEISTMTL